MSKGLTLAALVFGTGIVLLLISLARTDLSRVVYQEDSLDRREKVSSQSGHVKERLVKRQLLAFIGVQVPACTLVL